MDEQQRPDETRDPVEDLEPTADDAEQVKGGAPAGTFTLTFNGQTTPAGGDPHVKRGGWDGNHNDTLIGL